MATGKHQEEQGIFSCAVTGSLQEHAKPWKDNSQRLLDNQVGHEGIILQQSKICRDAVYRKGRIRK
jgi:hypothetical protein